MTSHILLHTAKRLTAFLLLVSLTAGVFLAARQTRSSTPPVGDSAQSGTDAHETMPSTNAGTADDVRIPPLPPMTAQTAFSKDILLALSDKVSFPHGGWTADQLGEAGFSLSDETYTKNTHVLAHAHIGTLPDTYSRTRGTVYNVSYERETQMSAPVAVYTEAQAVLPAVDPYMGYLILAGSAKTDVLTSDGRLLVTFETEEYRPANTRDTDGHPLFYKEVDGKRQYFRIDEENGGFLPSDYLDIAHGRGVYFDYPASYGISDTDFGRIVRIESLAERVPIAYETEVELKTDTDTETETVPETEPPEDYDVNILSETTLWAYGYTPVWRKTGYYYTQAYNFSEGRACVLDANGRMQFLNESCYYAFNTKKSYYYHDWYVTEYLLPPLSSGEESIGFFYYDHGLVRVRRQVADWSYADRVAIDEDILIDKTGAEFPVPQGYDIVAYSDGVILLKRDGKYGYMDYTGAWIAQPIYDFARPFMEGLAAVGFDSGECLMIDTAGEIVIPAGIYTHISDASSGVIAAYSPETGWNVLYKMAKYTEG